jgi:hypothetical protein
MSKLEEFGDLASENEQGRSAEEDKQSYHDRAVPPHLVRIGLDGIQ